MVPLHHEGDKVSVPASRLHVAAPAVGLVHVADPDPLVREAEDVEVRIEAAA